MNANQHISILNRSRLHAIVMLSGLTLITAACGPAKPEAETTQNPARHVKAQTVSSGPSKPLIEVSGVGAFRDETRLSFKVGGVVEQITVREGDTVKAGQRLAWLDKQEVNAAVSQANAALDKAQRDLQRGKALQQDEVISKVQLDNLETALQVAKAQASQASFARQTAELVSPGGGVVLKRFAQVGEVLAPGQSVLMVGSKSSGFVLKVSLSDKQAVHLKTGNTASITFDALPDVKWTGKLIELSQAADSATGTYGALLAIDTQGNPNYTLLSGMQGKASIEPQGYSGKRTYVPIEAVVEGDSKTAWLFTVNAQNVVKRQAVKVAFVANDKLALEEALPEGTRVVSTGAAYLQDGETVQVSE